MAGHPVEHRVLYVTVLENVCRKLGDSTGFPPPFGGTWGLYPICPGDTGRLSEPLQKPPGAAWANWISPETLAAQVRNTAPFLETRPPETGRLIELGNTHDGFLRILANWGNILQPGLNREEQLQDYLQLWHFRGWKPLGHSWRLISLFS